MRNTEATRRVLTALYDADGPIYGALICKTQAVHTGTGYPILASLEEANWVTGRWEGGNPGGLKRPLRKFYRLTALGRREAAQMLGREEAAVG